MQRRAFIGGVAAVAASLTAASAATIQRERQPRKLVAEFKTSSRLGFVWQPHQCAKAEAIAKTAGFTVERVNPDERRATCSWQGKLTQENLDRLQDAWPLIEEVYPDPIFKVDQTPALHEWHEDMPELKQELDEILQARVKVGTWHPKYRIKIAGFWGWVRKFKLFSDDKPLTATCHLGVIFEPLKSVDHATRSCIDDPQLSQYHLATGDTVQEATYNAYRQQIRSRKQLFDWFENWLLFPTICEERSEEMAIGWTYWQHTMEQVTDPAAEVQAMDKILSRF